MRRIMNEQGGALNLVLVTVVMLSVLIAPLFMTLEEGEAQSIRAQNEERAFYMIESTIDLVSTALNQAINIEDISLGPTEFDHFVTAFNNLPIEYFGNADHRPQLRFVEGVPHVLEVTVTVGSGNTAVERTMQLDLAAAPLGELLENPLLGIFGQPAVASQDIIDDGGNYFREADSTIISPNNQNLNTSISLESYTKQFDGYFNAVMAERPQFTMESISLEAPDLSGYTLTAGHSPIIYNDVDYALTYAGDITFSPPENDDPLTVNGDLIAGGDIYFWKGKYGDDYNIIINGDVITNGTVDFNDHIKSLTVYGDFIAGDDLSFMGIENLIVTGDFRTTGHLFFGNYLDYAQIGGSLSAQSITFSDGEFGGNIVEMVVDGAILSKGDLSFYSIDAMTVNNGIRSEGEINFDYISNMNVKNSIKSRGHLYFNNTVENTYIEGDLASQHNLEFTSLDDWIYGLHLTGSGNIIGHNIVFTEIGNMTMTGSIVAGNIIEFEENIANKGDEIGGIVTCPASINGPCLSVAGSIYAVNSIYTYDNVNMDIAGSMYAGNLISFGGHLNNVMIGGTLLAGTSIECFEYITALDVNSYVATKGYITFYDGVGAVELGGISAGGTISYNVFYGTVFIDENPPPNPPAYIPLPVIDFRAWRTI